MSHPNLRVAWYLFRATTPFFLSNKLQPPSDNCCFVVDPHRPRLYPIRISSSTRVVLASFHTLADPFPHLTRSQSIMPQATGDQDCGHSSWRYYLPALQRESSASAAAQLAFPIIRFSALQLKTSLYSGSHWHSCDKILPGFFQLRGIRARPRYFGLPCMSSQGSQLEAKRIVTSSGLRHLIGRCSGFFFSRLPMEPIFMILGFLDNDGLYFFSLLNKWLHKVALSMFLHNNNFPAGSDTLLLCRPPYNVLRGLRIALFVEKLTDIIVRYV